MPEGSTFWTIQGCSSSLCNGSRSTESLTSIYWSKRKKTKTKKRENSHKHARSKVHLL
jgi:hypothetical protein